MLQVGPYAAIGVLGLLCWHFDARAVANADMMKAQATQFRQEQAAATQLAQKALHDQEAAYRAKAQEADNDYTRTLADARRSADSYVAHHRAVFVQSGPVASPSSAAITSAESHGADVPAPVPADSVLVSASDVQACTVATNYAVSAHDWATTLGN
jgi:hypothetical protein